MTNFTCRAAALTDELMAQLIACSADWEAENSCFGYRRNEPDDLAGRRVFIAEADGVLIGYLFGLTERTKQDTSVAPADTLYFELEELYVVPCWRSRGVGRELFRMAEEAACSDGLTLLMLETATKNWRAILHFYLDELGMEFWSARLFKRIAPTFTGN